MGGRLFERDIHGRVEKRGCLRPCVADEDVQLTEFIPNLAEHMGDLFWARDIGLDHQTIGAAFAHLRKRIDCGGLVLVVMDGYLYAARRQFQGDPSTDATGGSFGQTFGSS